MVNIFITGSTGYLGINLILRLINEPYKIIAFCRNKKYAIEIFKNFINNSENFNKLTFIEVII